MEALSIVSGLFICGNPSGSIKSHTLLYHDCRPLPTPSPSTISAQSCSWPAESWRASSSSPPRSWQRKVAASDTSLAGAQRRRHWRHRRRRRPTDFRRISVRTAPSHKKQTPDRIHSSCVIMSHHKRWRLLSQRALTPKSKRTKTTALTVLGVGWKCSTPFPSPDSRPGTFVLCGRASHAQNRSLDRASRRVPSEE